MNPTIERLKLIFLGIFAVANVAILIWTVGWAMPEQKCLEGHKWWDPYSRVCAAPILTSDITGRVITDKAARDAALKAIGRVPPPAPGQSAPPKP
jgi:hypothetical protein